ncbi:MAG: ABC transporter ATP-binding protein [Alphaproteobacteria bacterium]|nr:ABC transporter ATP-binding protein [Alphaproteobacteria bacterium]
MLAIEIVNITAGYDRHPALHHMTGQFKKGSLTAVVGPNGSGKSTLLKTIAGFIKPMSGQLKFMDKPRIGYLPQIAEIDRSFPLSVYDVVMMGHWPQNGLFKGVSATQREQAMKALTQVGMAPFAARSIGALSSGQFQRVLFARLMLQQADIILLDEPFSAIDSRTAHDLLHLIEDWHRAGKTIIAVLHDMEQVKHHFPDTLVLAREVVAWGETKTALADKHLAQAQQLSEHWMASGHDHAAECHRDSMRDVKAGAA